MRLNLTTWLRLQARKFADIFGNLGLFQADNDIDEHALLYQATIAPAYMPTSKHLKPKA